MTTQPLSALTMLLSRHTRRRDPEVRSSPRGAPATAKARLRASVTRYASRRRKKFVALAASNAVPAIYHFREYAQDGGLMSYGLNFSDVYRLERRFMAAGRSSAELKDGEVRACARDSSPVIADVVNFLRSMIRSQPA